MIKLHSRGEPRFISAPVVGVARCYEPAKAVGLFRSREDAADETARPIGGILLDTDALPVSWSANLPHVVASKVQPLVDGDVVSLQESGDIDTLFRVESKHNSLFVTEQCNSYCLMCSQPPREVDDIERRLALNSRAVRLMPVDITTLGITGGEPTLLGVHLGGLIQVCRESLPETQLAILSNGRRFADSAFVGNLSDTVDDKVLFTIPLYSDNAASHDFVVQSKGAFDETVLGFYNLAAANIRSEVRVVLHRQTIDRLPQLASFIQKNLPFVERVVFMGLEVTGFARANESQLWIEPPEYMSALSIAIRHLQIFGIPAVMYNLPKCLTPSSLWPFLRQSISDWKQEFLSQCDHCCEKQDCSGVFGTSSRMSSLIRPISYDQPSMA